MTPTIDPIPPKMTSARIRIEICSTKDWGYSTPMLAAVKIPAKPAVEAPIAKAITLYLSGFTPIDAAATSSSRIADHRRPTREWLIDENTKIASAKNASKR